MSEWSTFRVRHCAYSVPSRLIGERLLVRVYEDRIEASYRGTMELACERLLGRNQHRIDYRHVIWSLVRKPGGFARYVYREEMFPSGAPIPRVMRAHLRPFLSRLTVDLRAMAHDPVRSVVARTPESAPSADHARAVCLALQNHTSPTLLILDNVDAPTWRDHLPSGAVHVLVTTRDRAVLPSATSVSLDVLTIDEARRLADELAAQARDTAEGAARDRVLLNVLGLLPVAVEVAAKAVSQWHYAWSEYEQQLAAHPANLLDAEELRGNYPRGVFAALDLSITRCGEGTPARRLLEGAAAFAPEQVPREWAASTAGIDDDLTVRRALASLEALALVKTDSDGALLTLHRLLHRRVRELAAAASAEAWAATRRRALVCAMEWMKATVDIGRISVVEARRAHVEALLSTSEGLGESAWSALADRLATHLWHRAEHRDAQGLFIRALGADEAALGPDHPRVAARLSNLSNVLQALGDAAGARPLLERALRLSEAALGPDHPHVATCLSNLAMVLQALGDAAGARPLLERALRIHEAALGPDHPNVARDLSHLAMVLDALGDAAGARPLLERALRIDEVALGPDHPSVAISLSNLALELLDLGDAAGARPLLERAVAILERALGPGHPNTRTVRRNFEALGAPAQIALHRYPTQPP